MLLPTVGIGLGLDGLGVSPLGSVLIAVITAQQPRPSARFGGSATIPSNHGSESRRFSVLAV
jgi:hypothetical protein